MCTCQDDRPYQWCSYVGSQKEEVVRRDKRMPFAEIKIVCRQLLENLWSFRSLLAIIGYSLNKGKRGENSFSREGLSDIPFNKNKNCVKDSRFMPLSFAPSAQYMKKPLFTARKMICCPCSCHRKRQQEEEALFLGSWWSLWEQDRGTLLPDDTSLWPAGFETLSSWSTVRQAKPCVTGSP